MDEAAPSGLGLAHRPLYLSAEISFDGASGRLLCVRAIVDHVVSSAAANGKANTWSCVVEDVRTFLFARVLTTLALCRKKMQILVDSNLVRVLEP